MHNYYVHCFCQSEEATAKEIVQVLSTAESDYQVEYCYDFVKTHTCT